MDQNGNFSSEFEAAYACSKRTASYPREQHLVDAHVANGKHVLVFSAAQYCGFTDAILGDSVKVVSVHDSLSEAQAAYTQHNSDDEGNGDCYYRVASPRAVAPEAVAVVEVNEDDIPF